MLEESICPVTLQLIVRNIIFVTAFRLSIPAIQTLDSGKNSVLFDLMLYILFDSFQSYQHCQDISLVETALVQAEDKVSCSRTHLSA